MSLMNRRFSSVFAATITMTAIAASTVTNSAVATAAVAQTSPTPRPEAEKRDSATNRMNVVFNGEVRTRTEWDHPGGPLRNDMFTFLRTRFGARIDAHPGVQLVIQAQDSRVLGAEDHLTAAPVSAFGLHQAYVDLRGTWHARQIALRAGRQEIAIGNERLVGSVGWSNLGRSFDGVRLFIEGNPNERRPSRWAASLYAATVEERGRRFGGTNNSAVNTDSSKHDHILAGFSATFALPGISNFEATALYDVGDHYRQFTLADRLTLDMRLRSAPARFLGMELEAAWQGGKQRDAANTAKLNAQTVSAWLIGARAGAFASSAHRGSFIVGMDMLSGDASPHDGNYRAFGTMYGSNHAFYGLLDVIGDPSTTTHERGLVDVLTTGSYTLSSRFGARAEAHRFFLNSGIGRDLGWEIDVLAPVRLMPTATLDIGLSAFRAGANAADVGLGARGTTRDWAFVQLKVNF